MRGNGRDDARTDFRREGSSTGSDQRKRHELEAQKRVPRIGTRFWVERLDATKILDSQHSCPRLG